MVPYRMNIVIGCMESLAMRHLALVIGHVGMELPLNNCAAVDYCIMNRLTAVIGQTMLMVVKSTVSHSYLNEPTSRIILMGNFPYLFVVLYFIHFHFIALCNEDPNGNVPLGKSCNRYWSCQGGYPRLQRCPAMLVFDKHSLRCVVPPTEDCDVPTTQQPPLDDYPAERGQVSTTF